MLSQIPHYVPISAHKEWNLDELLERMWEYLAMIRIYTKPKGQARRAFPLNADPNCGLSTVDAGRMGEGFRRMPGSTPGGRSCTHSTPTWRGGAPQPTRHLRRPHCHTLRHRCQPQARAVPIRTPRRTRPRLEATDPAPTAAAEAVRAHTPPRTVHVGVPRRTVQSAAPRIA